MSIVYLNGKFMPLEKATIHVLDRGFIFADGVYEVIPIFNNKILRLKQHLQRLANSLDGIYIDNPFSNEEWSAIFSHLIEQNEYQEQSIYVQVTRGISERDHDIDICETPTVFAMCRPIIKKDYHEGVKAITHKDIRWDYCDIKAISLLPSVILRHRAKLQGAKEAILIRNGLVSEGAASNVFVIKDGVIKTPPKTSEVLPGITRDLVLELLDNKSIDFEEVNITESELREADEIWITSSTWEIIPVVGLDNEPVGDGRPGELWGKVNQLYQQYKGHL